MEVGDHVTVSNVSGNTDANQANVALTAVQPRQIWSLWNPMYYTILTATPSGNATIIATDHPHGFSSGTVVLISHVTSAPALNRTWTITVTGPETFSIPAAISAYNSDDQAIVQQAGALISIVATGVGDAGESCLATLAVSHNLLPGWKVHVAGSSDTTENLNRVGTYGSYNVKGIPSPSTFSFACPKVPDGIYNTYSAPSQPFTVASYPGVALADGVAGNGAYSNVCTSWSTCGQIVSTENNKNFAEISFMVRDRRPLHR